MSYLLPPTEPKTMAATDGVEAISTAEATAAPIMTNEVAGNAESVTTPGNITDAANPNVNPQKP